MQGESIWSINTIQWICFIIKQLIRKVSIQTSLLPLVLFIYLDCFCCESPSVGDVCFLSSIMEPRGTWLVMHKAITHRPCCVQFHVGTSFVLFHCAESSVHLVMDGRLANKSCQPQGKALGLKSTFEVAKAGNCNVTWHTGCQNILFHWVSQPPHLYSS